MRKPLAFYNELDPGAAAWLRELIRAGAIAPGDVDERSIEDVHPSDLRGYTQCHFFAGIGVWSYALRLAGWPDHRPVWTGSCPCQPFSAAGKGGGFADERHLWPAWYHLIGECNPGVVFGEQVASPDGLLWLDTVHADLEAAGYACGALDICAAGVGAPHIRQRLFFVADAMLSGRPKGWAGARHGQVAGRSGIGVLGDAQRARLERHGGYVDGAAGWTFAHRPVATSSAVGGLADTDGRHTGTEGLQRGREHGQLASDGSFTRGLEHAHDVGRQRRQAPASGYDDERTSPERAQGEHGLGRAGPPRLPEHRAGPTHGVWRAADWLLCRDGQWRPVEPGTFPMVDGAPARVGRLRGYGNAIVAPLAAAFIEAYRCATEGASVIDL